MNYVPRFRSYKPDSSTPGRIVIELDGSDLVLNTDAVVKGFPDWDVVINRYPSQTREIRIVVESRGLRRIFLNNLCALSLIDKDQNSVKLNGNQYLRDVGEEVLRLLGS